MLRRYKRDARTVSALIDALAEGQDLQGVTQKVNSVVPPDQRGTSEALTAGEPGSARCATSKAWRTPALSKPPQPHPRLARSLAQVGKSKGAEKDD